MKTLAAFIALISVGTLGVDAALWIGLHTWAVGA